MEEEINTTFFEWTVVVLENETPKSINNENEKLTEVEILLYGIPYN
ncbi:MAG: hypothetical protein WCX46_02065 [Candidatus Paceibacterota bacterium]